MDEKEKVQEKENYLEYTKVDLYKIMPDLDSQIMQIEANLEDQARYDPQSWKKYRKNPTPFIMDLIGDFGTFPNKQWPTDKELRHLAKLVR